MLKGDLGGKTCLYKCSFFCNQQLWFLLVTLSTQILVNAICSRGLLISEMMSSDIRNKLTWLNKLSKTTTIFLFLFYFLYFLRWGNYANILLYYKDLRFVITIYITANTCRLLHSVDSCVFLCIIIIIHILQLHLKICLILLKAMF